MATDPRKYTPLTCPMPDCVSPLHLCGEASSALCAAHLDAATDTKPVPTPFVGDFSLWRIECTSGHVVLVPTEYPGCGCDDPRGDGCPHAEDEYDWSDEARVFSRNDMRRLAALLNWMGAPNGD